MRTYTGMGDYYNSKVAEMEAKEAERWQTVEGDPSWPAERFFAVVGGRDFRIFHDPRGEHVLLPDAAGTAADWWILVVRDTRQQYLHLGAYRTVPSAMQAAEGLWAGPALD